VELQRYDLMVHRQEKGKVFLFTVPNDEHEVNTKYPRVASLMRLNMHMTRP